MKTIEFTGRGNSFCVYDGQLIQDDTSLKILTEPIFRNLQFFSASHSPY